MMDFPTKQKLSLNERGMSSVFIPIIFVPQIKRLSELLWNTSKVSFEINVDNSSILIIQRASISHPHIISLFNNTNPFKSTFVLFSLTIPLNCLLTLLMVTSGYGVPTTKISVDFIRFDISNTFCLKLSFTRTKKATIN